MNSSLLPLTETCPKTVCSQSRFTAWKEKISNIKLFQVALNPIVKLWSIINNFNIFTKKTVLTESIRPIDETSVESIDKL